VSGPLYSTSDAATGMVWGHGRGSGWVGLDARPCLDNITPIHPLQQAGGTFREWPNWPISIVLSQTLPTGIIRTWRRDMNAHPEVNVRRATTADFVEERLREGIRNCDAKLPRIGRNGTVSRRDQGGRQGRQDGRRRPG